MNTEHMKVAISGNGAAWIGVVASFASQLLPLFQVLATVLAGAASVATFLYFRKRTKAGKDL